MLLTTFHLKIQFFLFAKETIRHERFDFSGALTRVEIGHFFPVSRPHFRIRALVQKHVIFGGRRKNPRRRKLDVQENLGLLQMLFVLFLTPIASKLESFVSVVQVRREPRVHQISHIRELEVLFNYPHFLRISKQRIVLQIGEDFRKVPPIVTGTCSHAQIPEGTVGHIFLARLNRPTRVLHLNLRLDLRHRTFAGPVPDHRSLRVGAENNVEGVVHVRLFRGDPAQN